MTAPAHRTETVVFYVSGHGYGHASRVIEVINAAGALAPEARLIVRTPAARWLFDATLRTPAEVDTVETDTGIVQSDSLRLDAEATADRAEAFYRTFADRAAVEAAVLRECGATVVVSDMPPLAFEAAHLAGVPAVALGNFTWDWIYAAYPAMADRAPAVVPTIRAAYRHATLTLRLPMWGGFEDWHSPIVDLPFVARHSRRDRDEVRAALGIPPGRRLVLASFGGLGISGLDLTPLGRLDGYTVLTTGRETDFPGGIPKGVVVIGDQDVNRRGLRYEDLVHASDIVVSKPGYGIIAECVANGAALLYTSRGHFVEYDVLVAAMPRFLRCRYIGHDELFAGRWTPHLNALLASPNAPDAPRTDGAPLAARHVLEVARRG